MIPEFSGTFQGGLGGGEFSLVEEATPENALNFGISGCHFQGGEGGLFRLGIATSEIESAGFEFAGCGIVFIPPEGLAGRHHGPVVPPRGPEFGIRILRIFGWKTGDEKEEEEKGGGGGEGPLR